MMQTHRDDDFHQSKEMRKRFAEEMSPDFLSRLTEQQKQREEWLRRLEFHANEMKTRGLSQITAGKPGEEPLDEWEYQGVVVRQMPEDEHGILRISIGGGEHTPVVVNYCVFRGDRVQCLELLKKAVRAMEVPDRPIIEQMEV